MNQALPTDTVHPCSSYCCRKGEGAFHRPPPSRCLSVFLTLQAGTQVTAAVAADPGGLEMCPQLSVACTRCLETSGVAWPPPRELVSGGKGSGATASPGFSHWHQWGGNPRGGPLKAAGCLLLGVKGRAWFSRGKRPGIDVGSEWASDCLADGRMEGPGCVHTQLQMHHSA